MHGNQCQEPHAGSKTNLSTEEKVLFSRWLVINNVLLSLLSIKFKLRTADDSIQFQINLLTFNCIFICIYMTIGEC